MNIISNEFDKNYKCSNIVNILYFQTNFLNKFKDKKVIDFLEQVVIE
jgi:hypothetical protein